MAKADQDHGVRRIHVVRSGVGEPCPSCGEGMWSGEAEDWLAQGVNHLLGHGWLLLHVGQETRGDFEAPHQDTVAVLGEPS